MSTQPRHYASDNDGRAGAGMFLIIAASYPYLSYRPLRCPRSTGRDISADSAETRRRSQA